MDRLDIGKLEHHDWPLIVFAFQHLHLCASGDKLSAEAGDERHDGLRVLLVLLIISGVLYAQTPERVQSLIDVQAASQTGVVGFMPAQIRHAYGFDQIQNQGEGQTIALVNAFDHPAIEQDFAIFNQMSDLPPCTTALPKSLSKTASDVTARKETLSSSPDLLETK